MENLNEKMEDSGFQHLELKANLNPEQRAYLDVLKDKMKRVLGNKTKQELAKTGDLEALKKYKIVLESILKFLRTKKMKFNKLEFTNAEGHNVWIDLPKELKYWTDFYASQGVDWAGLPGEIQLTKENKEELEKGAKALCADGRFEKLKLLIIPENIISTPDRFNKLQHIMCQGYDAIHVENEFTERRELKIKPVKTGLRLILVKNVKNLPDDNLYKITLDISYDILTRKDGILDSNGLGSVDLATYLIWQREYFNRTGEHLDSMNYTFLNQSIAENQVYMTKWKSWDGYILLSEFAVHHHAELLGCRLAKVVEINES